MNKEFVVESIARYFLHEYIFQCAASQVLLYIKSWLRAHFSEIEINFTWFGKDPDPAWKILDPALSPGTTGWILIVFNLIEESLREICKLLFKCRKWWHLKKL
jgi:hypothetical protein